MRFGWLTMDTLQVPVWVSGERQAYGRKDLRVTPAGGAGALWVAATRVIIPEGVTLGAEDDAGFAREVSARVGSVAMMRDMRPMPPRSMDPRTQELYNELKRGGVTPSTDAEHAALKGIRPS